MTIGVIRRAAVVALSIGCAACGDSASPSIVTSLVAPDSIVVAEFDSSRIPLVQLDASGQSLSSDGAVAWVIADSTVATIDRSGQLQYRRPGTTTAVAFSHGLTRAVHVTAGVRFAIMASGTEGRGFMRWCGVTTRGTLYCLGSGNSVTIGTDTLTRLETPAAPIRQLSVGYEHVCAVTTDNAGWCWGINLNGVLGSDTMLGLGQPVMVPVRVGGQLSFASIDAGAQHSCGVTFAAGVVCWGLHTGGHLGDGDSTFYGPRTTPTPVSLPGSAIDVAAGSHVSCALLTDRSAWCWGANNFGALGVGSYPPVRAYAPTRVVGSASYQSLSAGADHLCARTTVGTAECWGSNTWGQLGTTNDVPCPYSGGFRCVLQPVEVQTTQAFVHLETGGLIASTGSGSSCGLNTVGEVYCWGANINGEVGIGSTTNQPAPVQISGPVPVFASISVGDFHACGFTTKGVAWCWGYGFGLTATRLPNQY